ncbi:hypothetical protein Tco_0122643 [Tanacetum coccineum]
MALHLYNLHKEHGIDGSAVFCCNLFVFMLFRESTSLGSNTLQEPTLALNGSDLQGRDVVSVVASVLISEGVTSDDCLVDETSVKGAITGGVDVTV